MIDKAMWVTLKDMLLFRCKGNIEFPEAVAIGSMAWVIIIFLGFLIYRIFQ